MKIVRGYVRTVPGGDPIGSIQVTVQDANTRLPIPVGGMILASTNPTTTDPTGLFEWTAELSPGPIEVEAQVSLTERKVRSGAEVMQAGEVFISDQQELFLIFSDGVITDVYDDLLVTASVSNRDITVNAGRCCLVGRLWGIDTPRILTAAPNTTLASRRDLVVARQYIGGSYAGRQDLVLVAGTVNGVDPTINANPDILEFPLARFTIAQNAGTGTITDLRVFSTSFINDNTVSAAKLTAATNLSTTDAIKVLKAPTSGLTPEWSTVALKELSDVSSTVAVVGNFLRYDGSVWSPSSVLPTHAHAQSDILNLTTDLAAKAGLSSPAFTGAPTIAGYLIITTNDTNAILTKQTGGLEIFRVNNLNKAVTILNGSAFNLWSDAGSVMKASIDGATGKIFTTGEAEIDGALNHDGSTAGFYGVAPVARAAAPTAISSATVGATWGTGEQAVVDSTRDALNDVITALRNIGIIS